VAPSSPLPLLCASWGLLGAAGIFLTQPVCLPLGALQDALNIPCPPQDPHGQPEPLTHPQVSRAMFHFQFGASVSSVISPATFLLLPPLPPEQTRGCETWHYIPDWERRPGGTNKP